MTEEEFLRDCHKLIANSRRGIALCDEARKELAADLDNGRISHDEWRIRTDENDRLRAFFIEKLMWLGEGLDRMKKH